MTDSEESVQYDILINAADALKTVNELNKTASSIPEVISNIQKAMENFSAETGLSLGAVEKEFKSVIALSNQLQEAIKNPITAPTILQSPNALNVAGVGNPFEAAGGLSVAAGFQAVNDARREGIRLAQEQAKTDAMIAQEINAQYEAELLKASASKSVMEINNEFSTSNKTFSGFSSSEEMQSLNAMGEEWKVVGDNASKTSEDVAQGSQKMVGGINVVRTAMHLLVVGAIFEVINAFRQLFTTAIDGLKSLEVSVYNLANAERALSESGINITFKDLEAVVDRLHDKFQGLFSRVSIQDTVADIAIATKELGLSADQIEKIAQASAALQLRNPERTLQDVNKQLLTAILSGQTKGIRSLGVEASEAAIQQKALEMGLVQVGQKADAQAKSLATLQLVYEATVGDTKNLAQYQNSLAGVTQTLQATWQDFLSELAKDFAPLLIQGLKVLIFDLQVVSAIFTKISPVIREVTSTVAAFVASIRNLPPPTSLLNWFAIGALVADRFKANKQIYDDYFAHFTDSADTATAAVQNLGEAFDSAGFGQELQKIIEDTARALDDLNTQLARKQEDLDTQYQRKAQDALLNYQQKVQDIQQEGATKVQNIKQKARQEDKTAEAKYQLDLWELQQKYLMDLEDALHNRDARAILKLQQQYAFQKEDLAKKHKIDENQRAQDVATQVKQAEEDTARKLAQAKVEYDRKLQDLNIAKQREEDDLQKWYRRETDDLHKTEQRKLQDLITSWINQGKITQAGAQQVYNILKSYFGPGGATDQLYQYMMQSLGNALQSALNLGSAAGGIVVPNGNGTNTLINTTSSPVNNVGNQTSLGTFSGGLAGGGTMLATNPQTIRVAENSPEIIQATPLGGSGIDMNKLFSNAGAGINNGQDGMSGKLELAVNLSPDLELRVIRKAMDGTADIITRVNNSKV